MNNWGKFLQNLPPVRLALGSLFLVAVASYSCGMAAVNFTSLPGEMAAMDSSMVAVGDELSVMGVRLNVHIVQDSTDTARLLCLVRRLSQTGPVNEFDPLSCG